MLSTLKCIKLFTAAVHENLMKVNVSEKEILYQSHKLKVFGFKKVLLLNKVLATKFSSILEYTSESHPQHTRIIQYKKNQCNITSC